MLRTVIPLQFQYLGGFGDSTVDDCNEVVVEVLGDEFLN